jgi:exopolyphosphatase/guanosine-5'-triphosphate,3'-diphosphate pyrophosphatase
MKTKPPGYGPQRLAAIDIGTNTFRLLIAEVRRVRGNKYNIKEISSERIVTRLGEGIVKTGLLKKTAISRGISALKKFRRVISRHHADRIFVAATSALRDAKNKNTFLKKAEKTTGFKIEIISGKEEAEKTSSGMLAGINRAGTALMIDIGGGSTELIFIKKKKNLLIKSLNLGVVYLAEKYMKNDPPLKEDLSQMGREISRKIKPLIKHFTRLFPGKTALIGTAGTVTTLAAITKRLTRFEQSKIHNSKITLEKIRRIFYDISTVPAKERIKYHPFDPTRLDIIVPGTLILIKIMESLGFKEIIVSNYGLREGIIIGLYNEPPRHRDGGVP